MQTSDHCCTQFVTYWKISVKVLHKSAASITVQVSRSNLLALLAKLDGHPPARSRDGGLRAAKVASSRRALPPVFVPNPVFQRSTCAHVTRVMIAECYAVS